MSTLHANEVAVFIVDDHPVIRRGLTEFINSHQRFSV